MHAKVLPPTSPKKVKTSSAKLKRSEYISIENTFSEISTCEKI